METKFDLGIIGGTIIFPDKKVQSNIYIKNSQIAFLSEKRLALKKEINASGLLIFPGMIDTHVHFMDPGDPSREDFPSGSQAAVQNGVTTVIEHTHGWPIKTVADLEKKKAHLNGRSCVDYALGAHVWPGLFENIKDLWSAGIVMFKIFTCTTHGIPGIYGSELKKALEQIEKVNGLALIHAEDENMSKWQFDALKKKKRNDPGVITEWRSRLGEEVAISSVVLIARDTQTKVVIAHASSPEVIKIIKCLRDSSKIFIETCPQYLFLLEQEIMEKGALRKFTPPARARSEDDINRMWIALKDGSIDLISSDHAPSTIEQKIKNSIWDAPFGLPGIDTTFPIMLNAALENKISLELLSKVYSTTPSKIYGLFPRKGNLDVGADADLVIVDPSGTRKIKNESIISKSGWTPFEGFELKGRVLYTFIRGNCIVEDGVFLNRFNGKFIPGPGKNS